MDHATYAQMAKLMSQIPPSKETPPGQKFHIGEIVKIANPKSWFAKDREGKLATIEYTYEQKYGCGNVKQYSLIFDFGSSAWYNETELELVKGIDEITEERDRVEYERLKLKYKK